MRRGAVAGQGSREVVLRRPAARFADETRTGIGISIVPCAPPPPPPLRHQRPAPSETRSGTGISIVPCAPPPLPHFPIRDPLHQRPAPSETRSGTGIRIVPCAPRPSAPLTSTPSLPAPPPFRPSTLLISRPFPSLPAPSAIFRHPPCTHPRGAL